MTDVAELRAEIQRETRADAPRLVLADLLEQRGDVDRAQLIQVQVKRAALPAWEAQAAELELVERALLSKHEAAWRKELPTLGGVTWGSFTRGFVGTASFDKPDVLAKHLAACLAATPIHRVVMTWPRSKTKLAPIEGLTDVTLVGTVMRSDDLKWLAASPILAGVRSLALLDSNVRQGLPNLLKSPHLTSLEALRLPSNEMGNASVTKLLEALPNVTELDLSITSVPERGHGSGRDSTTLSIAGAKAAESLANWPGLANLHTLDVSGWELGRTGLGHVLASPYSKGLRSLRVRDIADAEWEMDDSLAAFEAGPYGALEALDIGENDLDGDAASYVANARALAELKALRIDRVRSRSFERLAQAKWIHTLRVLAGDADGILPLLARAPQRLHTLQVTSQSHAFVGQLDRLPLPALATLDLSALPIDDAACRHLAELDTLPKLTSLRLRPHGRFAVAKPAYSRAAVTALAQSPLGKRLVSFDVGLPDLDRLPPPRPPYVGDGIYAGPSRYL